MQKLIILSFLLACATSPAFRPKSKSILRVMIIDTTINGNIPQIRRYLRFNSFMASEITNDHGSHIAGIIAAAACPGVEIIPCRGAWDFKASNNCLRYAMDLKVDIINYSMGGDYPEPEEAFLFKKLETKGIIVNAAAGNNNRALFIKPYYPASYNLGNINIIGALGDNGLKADFSNYSNSVIWESGVNIESFNRFGGRVKYSGTSQATANHTARMVKEWCNK